MLNPEVVYINHFTEPDANYKGKQVARTKGTFQNHQSDHKQCLENIIPCTESTGKAILKTSGTEEMVEIPKPLLDIRSTPRELISRTMISAASPAR